MMALRVRAAINAATNGQPVRLLEKLDKDGKAIKWHPPKAQLLPHARKAQAFAYVDGNVLYGLVSRLGGVQPPGATTLRDARLHHYLDRGSKWLQRATRHAM